MHAFCLAKQKKIHGFISRYVGNAMEWFALYLFIEQPTGYNAPRNSIISKLVDVHLLKNMVVIIQLAGH